YNGTKFPAANATCEPFTLNVVPQFGANFTPGFWKNHPKATNPFLPITLGNYNVTTFANAVIILSGMGCGNFGALNCMAGMLLAAKLNLADGGGTCIIPTIAAADALLIANGYTGVTAGQLGSYTLTPADQALAMSLHDKLSAYNVDAV